MKNSHIILLLAFLAGTTGKAQMLNEMFKEDTSLSDLPAKSLRTEIDATAFFRDNEYDSEVQNGYSLPGVRLTPHIAYNPLSQINIELGASMLFFNGANKYPCFAYHDIGTWKGNQYQRGSHVLPWVRLQASLKHVDVILGNIYGGANHELIAPLFNPEQNISADPEMGLQILLHRPHINLDTWLNWQSYIFEEDSHQEAFTVGTNAKILWNSGAIQYYSPVQLLIQHRGGEQDNTNMMVQTICNASIGAGMRIDREEGRLNFIDAQANAIACYQQAGELWPFDTGFAWHAGVKAGWFKHLSAGLDYVHSPRQFVSLYGNPFYNTLSLIDGGTQITEDGSIVGTFKTQYTKMHNVRLGIDYQYTFAKAYTLGAEAEVFCINGKKKGMPGRLSETCFSFGVYLRVSPSFIIKKF